MRGHRNPDFDAAMMPLLDEAFDFAARLTRDDQAAEELTQEAFARAFESFARFTPGTSPRAWLFTILRNLFFNLERGRRRHALVPLEDAPEPSREPKETADATPALDRAIAALPVKLREAVVLDLQGLTCKEIGAIAHCPPGTVMSRLFRARQLLRAQLEAAGLVRGGEG